MTRILLVLLLLFTKAVLAQEATYDSSNLVLVLPIDDHSLIDGTDLGPVKFKDKLFTFNCTYFEVIANLKVKAWKMGGNLIKIIDHKKPDMWSTCHRISVEVYKVANTEIYERQIEWTPGRKLTHLDFKGVPGKDEPDSNAAATWSGFQMEFTGAQLFKSPRFYVSCIFDCNKSWMKPEVQHNRNVLQHEQTHFDISEVYARKMRQALKLGYIKEYNIDNANDIYKHYLEASKVRQDLYDLESEHGRNMLQQQKWDTAIATELAELGTFIKEEQ